MHVMPVSYLISVYQIDQYSYRRDWLKSSKDATYSLHFNKIPQNKI
jgi:hypothetical protein